MKQIKYLSFIPFLALLCLMTGCENDKDVYYPYVNNSAYYAQSGAR